MVYSDPIHKRTRTLKPHIPLVAVAFYNFRLYWQKILIWVPSKDFLTIKRNEASKKKKKPS